MQTTSRSRIRVDGELVEGLLTEHEEVIVASPPRGGASLRGRVSWDFEFHADPDRWQVGDAVAIQVNNRQGAAIISEVRSYSDGPSFYGTVLTTPLA